MMRPLKLYLHIGTAKTGTTSIQELFHRNRAFLLRQGYYYLSSEGAKHHRRLACYGMPAGQSDEFLRALQIKTQNERRKFNKDVEEHLARSLAGLPEHVHSVVCSSEHFHSRCTQMAGIERLASLLQRHFSEIKVIVYLRPQIDVALSLYSTTLKAGGEQRLDTFLDKHCRPENYYYDYASLLDNWARAFGPENICPRRFEKEAFRQGDLLADALACCGIAAKWQDQAIQRPAALNESLNTFGQFMLRSCNQSIARFNPDHTWNSLAGRIHEQIARHCVGPTGIEPGKASRLQARFDDINSRVCHRWFPEREALFTFDRQKYRPGQATLGEQERQTIGAIYELLEQETIRQQQDANILRDAALALEKNNLPLAMKMMELAAVLRPEGVLIQKKLADYRQILK